MIHMLFGRRKRRLVLQYHSLVLNHENLSKNRILSEPPRTIWEETRAYKLVDEFTNYSPLALQPQTYRPPLPPPFPLPPSLRPAHSQTI